MLGHKVRKSLREQKWHNYITQYKNPSDAWSTIKKAVNTGIADLPLLANLPKEKQEIIFTSDNVEKILNCLFSVNLSNSKKVEIAASLVSHGLEICRKEYEHIFQDIPDVIKPTSDHLYNTIKICNDIAYKSTLTSIEENALEKQNIFLFNWNKALTREKNRFDKFISSVIGENISTTDLQYTSNKTIIKGRLTRYERTKSPYFDIQIYPYAQNVDLRINDVTLLVGDTPKKGAIIERNGELKYRKKIKIDFKNNEFLLYKKIN